MYMGYESHGKSQLDMDLQKCIGAKQKHENNKVKQAKEDLPLRKT